MDLLALVTLLLGCAVAALLTAHLARTVRRDGYGHRPPPASHAAWWDGTTLAGR